ncbi:MAG: HEAT repeat domain-containing protein [Armatimonadota bacterium]
MPVTDVSKYQTREWFDILLPIFHGEDQYSRVRAAYAFGELLEGRAVGPLLAALDDDNPGVRAIAAAALGMLRVHRATERLQRLCDDVDPDVRECAEEALESIGCKPEYSMRFTDQKYHPTVNPRQDRSSISRQSWSRKEVYTRLKEAVNRVMKHNAEMEGREVSGIPLIKRCAEMMRALGWAGEEPDVMEVAGRMLKHHERVISSAGLEILEHSDDPRASELLRSNLTNEDILSRMYTARALARKGATYPLEPFAACIDEMEMWLPDEAIESLVELGDICGAGLLIKALQHQRVDIRRQAGEALIALTGEDFGWDLEMWERWWEKQ